MAGPFTPRNVDSKEERGLLVQVGNRSRLMPGEENCKAAVSIQKKASNCSLLQQRVSGKGKEYLISCGMRRKGKRTGDFVQPAYGWVEREGHLNRLTADEKQRKIGFSTNLRRFPSEEQGVVALVGRRELPIHKGSPPVSCPCGWKGAMSAPGKGETRR